MDIHAARFGATLARADAGTDAWGDAPLSPWRVYDTPQKHQPSVPREVFAPSAEEALKADSWWHWQEMLDPDFCPRTVVPA